MDIRVSGHQLDVGASLTAHAQDRISALAGKYSVGMTGGSATMAPGPHEHEFAADIVVQLTQGIVMKSSAKAHGAAKSAFDAAADKIETQLRRYKRKLNDREKRGAPPPQIGADYKILQRDEREEIDDSEEAHLIVAESAEHIPDVSVADAVMLLDLRDTPAMMFKNAQSGNLSMVYRREDGHIGWVEPK
ncbi:MAG: HPF/RaiA family ribosome-associated protein [Pacificimonas sp.]